MKNANHLIHEKSPYLLQHAHQPVDWYPWGEEAFEKAKREDKPIFLSIGYSTCHWCHNMARESFNDDEVAKILNEKYISIKVDREERPDIDSIYMKVCQMITGQGGWPLTVVLTPEQMPYFAGTYFPKTSKYEMPGMLDILPYLANQYEEKHDEVAELTQKVQKAFVEAGQTKSEHRLTLEATDQALAQLTQAFDETFGGFGPAPKFPTPHRLLFLLRKYQADGIYEALEMVEKTLCDMARGGIWDHIGYGFTRYSTDKEWLVPHFEKMLYDNALLLMAYTECYQITKKPFYKEIAEQIIIFLTSEMRDKNGAFYSAIDADSEGVEGKYYIWSYDEIIDILGEELGDLYANAYNILEEGYFLDKCVPNQIQVNWDDVTNYHNLNRNEIQKKLDSAQEKLRTVREQRVYPHVDDKILTSWNALTACGLAKAGKVFLNETYLSLSTDILTFIEDTLFIDDRLMTRYRDGEVRFKGYLDDYAFLLWAYLEMYEATFNENLLTKAKKLADSMFALFWDEKDGGFYFTGTDAETLITREKEIYDGAIPAGNSVAALSLARLAAFTSDPTYLERVSEMYQTFYNDVSEHAYGSLFFLISVLYTERPSKQVVAIGQKDSPELQQFISQFQQDFLPNISLIVTDNPKKLTSIAPFASQYKQIEDKPTFYICENFSCQAPTTDVEQALNTILTK